MNFIKRIFNTKELEKPYYDLYGEIKAEDGDGSGFGDDIDFDY